MENQKPSGIHQALGILGLIIGILGLIFSFIPCLGAYAIYAGIAGIVISLAAFFSAKNIGESIGLAVAGLVLSIIASAVALYQINLIS